MIRLPLSQAGSLRILLYCCSIVVLNDKFYRMKLNGQKQTIRATGRPAHSLSFRFDIIIWFTFVQLTLAVVSSRVYGVVAYLKI